MEFKIGDVVQLKSGGPKMTVASVKHDRAICIWFNGQDALHEEKSAEFLLATLKRTIHAASTSVSAGS